MGNDKKRLLTLAQMASELRLQAKELRREVEAGLLPAVQIGSKSLLFDSEAVHAVLLERAARSAEVNRGD